MQKSTDATGKLQRIFRFDFWFSAISGCTLILMGHFVGPMMIPDVSPLYIVAIGVGLLPWAFFNRYLSKQSRANSQLFAINLAGDTLWVVASIIGLIIGRDWLTSFGIATVIAAALIVAEFAWLKLSNWPYKALNKALVLPQSS